MDPVPIGSRVRPVRNSNSHNYVLGRVYTVSRVEGKAFQATGSDGQKGNWLSWDDCEPVVGLGWEYCRELLAPEVVEFLSAFQGIERITLKPAVKDEILRRRPDLPDAILAASRLLRSRDAEIQPET
jgi:hypothetical protein